MVCILIPWLYPGLSGCSVAQTLSLSKVLLHIVPTLNGVTPLIWCYCEFYCLCAVCGTLLFSFSYYNGSKMSQDSYAGKTKHVTLIPQKLSNNKNLPVDVPYDNLEYMLTPSPSKHGIPNWILQVTAKHFLTIHTTRHFPETPGWMGSPTEVDNIPYTLIDQYQHFGGTYSLHLHILPCRYRQLISLKCRYPIQKYTVNKCQKIINIQM